MSIETAEELEGLKKVGWVVGACLKHMGEAIKPGMKTSELDAIGAAFLAEHGARSAPMFFYGFPAHTCISLNEAVAHGIPGDQRIENGDLVNIDVSAEMNGFVADTGGSFAVGPVSPLKTRLLSAAKSAMLAGVAEARDGALLSNIGKAMEKEARKRGFTVIENLGSHGVGRKLHEEPGFIPGYFDPKDKRRLKKGMVITVEPFVSNGARIAEDAGDGWTLLTPKRFSAQYEHTIVITDDAPLILTRA